MTWEVGCANTSEQFPLVSEVHEAAAAQRSGMSHKKDRKHHHQNPEKNEASVPVSQPPEDRNPAGHKNHGGGDQQKRRFDWMTIFTGILALFAILSFIALWIQLRDARKSFAIDQRPYVWIANGEDGIFAEAVTNRLGGKQIVATMRFTNFGKSPAVMVRSYHAMILGPNSNKIRALPWVSGRRILPNGKMDLFSDVSDRVTDQEIAGYMNAALEGNGITLYATWQYSDTSGKKYETEICLTRLNLGAWEYCKEHNDIKDCSESACEP